MQILILTEDNLSDSYIFYADNQLPSPKLQSQLINGQKVVERQYLFDFPVLAIPNQEPEGVKLFDNVYQLYPEGWDVIDEADSFLMNENMYNLCKSEDSAIGLEINTAEKLLELFKTKMFIVVGVTDYEEVI